MGLLSGHFSQKSSIKTIDNEMALRKRLVGCPATEPGSGPAAAGSVRSKGMP
jgi:hypothetical protein